MQSGANGETKMIFTKFNNHLKAIGNHALNIIQGAELVSPGSQPIRDDI